MKDTQATEKNEGGNKERQEEERALARFSNYLEAPAVQRRFVDMMGERGAKTYISSVLLAVKDSLALQQCTPASIFTSALRAGTLQLSVDPGIGQAYMVPFSMTGKDDKKVKVATLIIGYKGLYDLAIRTGKYRYINVGPVYEGDVVIEDRISGFHRLEYDREYKANGRKGERKVIGWIGAFEMMSGYAKTFYMTVEEIHEHASRYSQSYADPKGPWSKEKHKMERKTCLRLMLKRWAPMDPSTAQAIQAEQLPTILEGEFRDGEVSEDIGIGEQENFPTGSVEDKIPASVEGKLAELGFQPEGKKFNSPEYVGLLANRKKIKPDLALSWLIEAHKCGKLADSPTTLEVQTFIDTLNA